MNNKIIEDNKKDSDLLLFKAFKITPFLLILNFIYLYISRNFHLEPIDFLTLSTFFISLVPLIYYKAKEDHSQFVIVSLICVELITTIFYLTSWVYASLMWVVSFGIVSLYFDAKLLKKMLFIKLPLLIVSSFLAIELRGELGCNLPNDFPVSSIIYYSLQLYMINLIYRSCSNKSNRIFELCLSQGSALQEVFRSNVTTSRHIDTAINTLSDNINTSSTSIRAIAQHSSDISVKAHDLANLAQESRDHVETIISQFSEVISQSENITTLTSEMKTMTRKNKKSLHDLSDTLSEDDVYDDIESAEKVIQSTRKELKNTLQDFDKMFFLQEDVLSRVDSVQALIEKLAFETNVLSDSSSQTLESSTNTCYNITSISRNLEELTTTIENISASIKKVQTSSNSLITQIEATGI